MFDAIEAALKFFSVSEFTWKRVVAAFFIVTAITIGVIWYEKYTASFKLSRLQKAADLLGRIQDLENRASTNRSDDLESARKLLVEQAIESIKSKPPGIAFVPTTLSFSMDRVWKFLAGASMWCFISLFQIPKLRERSNRQTFAGLLLVAIISGFFAVFVPAIGWPWFHIFVYPWLFVLGLIVILFPVGIVMARRSKPKNACIYNLRQIGGAISQWAIENKKTVTDKPSWDDIKPYLLRVPVCPSGGVYSLATPGDCPTCSLQMQGHKLPT